VKKIVIFLMLIFGMNVMALLVPCAEGDTKCVIQGFKVNGEIINEEGSQDIKYIVHFINNFAESGSIEIIGHADSSGTKRHNLKLSIIRAENAEITSYKDRITPSGVSKMIVEKGKTPHVLVMTATPIPRTLAVLMYGAILIYIV